jgi:hypothetical protein
MKIKNLFFLCVISGFLVLSVCAQEDDFAKSVFYSGVVSVGLDKESYAAGEVVRATIKADNLEDFPLVNCSFVVDVVRGGYEHVYPSQLSDADNVVYEAVFGGLDFDGLLEKNVSFAYAIPVDAGGGLYRLEAYFRADRTPVVGIPHIFLSPVYVSFNVSGAGDFPLAHIVRTETVFENVSGPVGAGVYPGSNVKGLVFVKSDSSRPLEGLVLDVVVCEWDDTSCVEAQRVWSQIFNVSVAANKTVRVEVAFAAPSEPDAYAIRMELKDKDGRTLSLYRNRLIVQGEAARVRKLAVDKPYYSSGDVGSIRLLIGPSPDHYTKPVVRNLKAYVDLRQGAKVVYSGSFVVSELSGEAGLIYKTFSFTAPQDVRDFTVCSKLESENGTLFDEYCYDVISSHFKVPEAGINASWTFDSKGKVEVRLCSGDSSKAGVSVSAVLVAREGGKVAGYLENIALAPCDDVSFDSGGGEYLLVVTDEKTNAQFEFNMSVPVIAKVEGPKEPVCGDAKCENGEDRLSCCADCGCPKGENCANNVCVVTEKPPQPVNGKENQYLIGVLLLFLVLALILLKKKRKNVGVNVK